MESLFEGEADRLVMMFFFYFVIWRGELKNYFSCSTISGQWILGQRVLLFSNVNFAVKICNICVLVHDLFL